MLIQKLPDYNGGFITKSIEGARIITRDAEGNILGDKPVNLVKKGIPTNFGKVIECGDDFVIIKSGLKTIRVNKHLLNTALHKAHPPTPSHIVACQREGEINLSETFETPIGDVLVDNVTDDIRATITNADYITHTATYSTFHKSVNSKLIKARVEEPLFKSAFLKSVKVETIGRQIKLFKSTAKIFDISKTGTTGGISWNTKGGIKPDHKYLERKPNPSGEGYIYLYELPNGKREWRDKSGETVQEQMASKEYSIDYKPGEAVRIGGKVGLIKEISENFLAVNVGGKMITINKNEHLKKLDEQKGYYEGAEIIYEGGKVKILKLTGSLALAQDLKTNRMKVIEIEQPISRAEDVNTKEYKQSIKDKYSHVYQGYDVEDYAYNLDYEQQPAYHKFWEDAKKGEFGRVDELTARKFLKISENETDNITWKYNPETAETEFLVNGQKDYPLYYSGKKYFVRNITEDGYSLEDPETKETGLFLAHSDYKKFKQAEYEKGKAANIVTKNVDPYGGVTIGQKTDKISIKPEYSEEQLARFNRKQFGGRWGKAQQAKQTAEKIKQENEVKQKTLKEKLGSKEYKDFTAHLKDRGYKLTENAFRAKKKIEVEGRKFKLTKTFDGNTEIEGPTSELKLGNDSYQITDIRRTSWREFAKQRMSRYMKELGGHGTAMKKIVEEWKEFNKTANDVRVYYDDNGTEKSKTIDELKEINGKNIFEPTRASKGIISNLPAQKIYFGTEDKDLVSGYYEVVEADELVPSNFAGGEVNPNYMIGSAQNRDRSKLQSKVQIEKIANNPNFDLVSDDKTAQNGAPIVNQDYNVVAGNGRAIGLIKHYELGQDKYKNDLVGNAKRLGFDADEIEKMKNPVLVRRTNVSNEEAQRLGAISNQDQKLALEENETAKGMATRIDDATFNKIADMFSNAKGDYASISDYLEDVGPGLVKELIKRNIIPENEQHLFYDLNSGKLNASHKDKVKQLLTQSVLGDSSAHFEKINNAAREGITKSLGDIFALKGKEGDLVPNITEAVKLLSKYEAMKNNFKSVDDFISQAANDAFEPLRADKKTLALFDLFAGTKPNEMKDKIREYRMSMEPDMFGDGLKPDAAFDQTFKPKYEKGINKSRLSLTLSKGKGIFRLLLKAVDTTKNILLPSKKNPLVRRWQNTTVRPIEGKEQEPAEQKVEESDNLQVIKKDGKIIIKPKEKIEKEENKPQTPEGKNSYTVFNDYKKQLNERQAKGEINSRKKNSLLYKKRNELGLSTAEMPSKISNIPIREIRPQDFEESGEYIVHDEVPEIIEKLKSPVCEVQNWANENGIPEINYYGYNKEKALRELEDADRVEGFENYDQTVKLYENVPQYDKAKLDEIQNLYKTLSKDEFEEMFPDKKSIADFIEYKVERTDNVIKTKDISPINETTDEILSNVQNKFGGKYSDVPIKFDKEGDPIEWMRIRIADHTGNYYSIGGDGTKPDLSIVISNKDATLKRFGRSENEIPNEFRFDEDSTPEEIIDFINEKIAEKKDALSSENQRQTFESKPQLPKIEPQNVGDDFGSERAEAQTKNSEEKNKKQQIYSENFKKWFGNSKVIDKSGNPLVVYHGTLADFSKFDTSKMGEHFGLDEAGFFFSSDPKVSAEPPADGITDGMNLMPAYLKIEKPLYIKTKEAASFYFDDNADEILAKAKNNKNDGIIIDGASGERLAVVFKPTQIKSATGNDGSFNPDDPNITKSIKI